MGNFEIDMLYEKQQLLNKHAFLTRDEFCDKKRYLFKILSEFDKQKIHYALYFSSSLFFLGMVDSFNDFDFLIDEDDVEKARNILLNFGASFRDENSFEINGTRIESQMMPQEEIDRLIKDLPINEERDYASATWVSLNFKDKNIPVELMSGFRIYDKDEDEYFTFSLSDHKPKNVNISNMEIPVISPEIQLILYGLMLKKQPHREMKFCTIRNYLLSQDKIDISSFLTCLKQNLPEELLDFISGLLSRFVDNPEELSTLQSIIQAKKQLIKRRK